VDAEQRPCPVCGEALCAAEEAVTANRALNESRTARREPGLELDMALHFGEVVYGNVGASRRLDFTVIGRAVNEACRMEAICGQVGRNLVLSEIFARRCPVPTVPVGTFALRGITGERAIYALQ
jgi:adenylate cyclase